MPNESQKLMICANATECTVKCAFHQLPHRKTPDCEHACSGGGNVSTAAICRPLDKIEHYDTMRNYRRPVTSIRLNPGPTHTRVQIFVNHANAGELTLRNDELNSFLKLIAIPAADAEVPRPCRKIIPRKEE